MNVDELRELLADVPGHTEVVVNGDPVLDVSTWAMPRYSLGVHAVDLKSRLSDE